MLSSRKYIYIPPSKESLSNSLRRRLATVICSALTLLRLLTLRTGYPPLQGRKSVYSNKRENLATVGGPVLEDSQALSALQDIGVTASDILQASSVIWVEGPSDRINVNRWIELIGANLIEGLIAPSCLTAGVCSLTSAWYVWPQGRHLAQHCCKRCLTS